MLGTGDVPEIVGAIEGASGAKRIPLTLVQRPNPASRIPHPGASNIFVRRRAPCLRDATPLRLHQGRGRLRLQVLLLHHPDAARPLPQPPGRFDRARGARARGARRARDDPDLAGHDLLRPRSRRAAPRFPALLRELNTVDGIDWIRLLYLYPTTITDDILDAMAECEKVVQVHRPAAAARGRRRPATDEAARHRKDVREAARPHPRARAGRLVADNVHRRVSRARPTPSSTNSARSCGTSGFDHVGVFTYSHEEGTTAYESAGRRAGSRQNRGAGTP